MAVLALLLLCKRVNNDLRQSWNQSDVVLKSKRARVPTKTAKSFSEQLSKISDLIDSALQSITQVLYPQFQFIVCVPVNVSHAVDTKIDFVGGIFCSFVSILHLSMSSCCELGFLCALLYEGFFNVALSELGMINLHLIGNTSVDSVEIPNWMVLLKVWRWSDPKLTDQSRTATLCLSWLIVFDQRIISTSRSSWISYVDTLNWTHSLIERETPRPGVTPK